MMQVGTGNRATCVSTTGEYYFLKITEDLFSLVTKVHQNQV